MIRGPYAIQSWEREIARVLPPNEYPVLDVPSDHAVFRIMFIVPELPQIPSISHWRRSGGGTRSAAWTAPRR